MKKDIKIIYNFFKNLLKEINKFNYGAPILYIENDNFATIKYIVNYSNSDESEQSYRNIDHCIYQVIKNIFGDKSFDHIYDNYRVTTNGVFDYHILPDFRINSHCLVQRSFNECITWVNFFGLNSEYIEVIKSIFGKDYYYENSIRKNN